MENEDVELADHIWRERVKIGLDLNSFINKEKINPTELYNIERRAAQIVHYADQDSVYVS